MFHRHVSAGTRPPKSPAAPLTPDGNASRVRPAATTADAAAQRPRYTEHADDRALDRLAQPCPPARARRRSCCSTGSSGEPRRSGPVGQPRRRRREATPHGLPEDNCGKPFAHVSQSAGGPGVSSEVSESPGSRLPAWRGGPEKRQLERYLTDHGYRLAREAAKHENIHADVDAASARSPSAASLLVDAPSQPDPLSQSQLCDP